MTRSAEAQLALALGPFVNRKLFSEHFLADVLPEWPEWAAADAPTASLLADLSDLWARERAGLMVANEAQTEERWVKPVLERLGFAYTVQAGIKTATGRRQPDYALFLEDADRRRAAERTGGERFLGAAAVCDAKRFDRPLDKRGREAALTDDPVAQIIHYVSVTRTRWGILTNGRLWRLYAAEGDLVEGACIEFDLGALLDAGDEKALRYFALMMTASSFAVGGDGNSVLDRMLLGSRARAVAVGERLRRQVFAALPRVAEGLLGEDERTDQALMDAFDNALVVLYRVLFCLNAEDRRLLPIGNVHYDAYSLQRQRRQLAEHIEHGRVFSSRSDDLFNDLRALFRIVDRGDPALDVNEYDGGLFASDRHPWLQNRTVPDNLMARALDLLYRVDREQVDYRDLSVRHLGTIFEQLLAFRLEVGPDGHLDLAAAGGRKATGAYFTPEHIVDEIVEQTLEPIYDARSDIVAARGLTGKAALDVLLDIDVLDPAMGSGHFLVGAAAYLSRRIATDPGYGGAMTLAELRGLVAERCLYGVDVNPMAVEVARLSLWLSTVRDDRPLRFLSNLRAGNALVGAELSALLDGGTDLFADELARRARRMLDGVARIAAIDARSGEEAHEQQQIAAELDGIRHDLIAACDAAVAPPVGAAAGSPLHWEIAFPDRFLDAGGELLADGGFDAVLGNPPYLRIQELGRDVAAHCRERYATAYGAFDAYVPFIERGLRLLKPAGRLGYIVPSTWIKLDYGRRLRALFARERLVEHIVDFGHAQIFDSATNYTCLLILQRGGVDALDYTVVTGDPLQVQRAVTGRRLPAPERYPSAGLSSEPWLLLPRDERLVLDAMLSTGPTLGESVEQSFRA